MVFVMHPPPWAKQEENLVLKRSEALESARRVGKTLEWTMELVLKS